MHSIFSRQQSLNRNFKWSLTLKDNFSLEIVEMFSATWKMHWNKLISAENRGVPGYRGRGVPGYRVEEYQDTGVEEYHDTG